MRTFAFGRSRLDIPTKDIIIPETINSFEKFLLTSSFRKTMIQKVLNFIIEMVLSFATRRYFQL